MFNHCYPFRDLKLMFVDSCHVEQLTLCTQHRVVVAVQDFVLRTEMTGLESQEEDVPKCVLFFKPMNWMG